MITRISKPTIQYAKFQQKQTSTKWQCLNIKLSKNMESTKFPTKKSKKWAHLEVHFGEWRMGLRILKDPFFIIPFKGWVILFPIKSKKRWPIGRCHCQCKKKWRFGDGFQKWVYGKIGQEHKDLKKNVEGDEWKQV